MDETSTPPTLVHKRDGRLVPFEADRISRALFAASEGLGRPDAFLARELTDGVVHFLAEECNGVAPTTSQIAELVVKVVRELGQPALAKTFEEHGRRRERKTAPAPLVAGDKPADSGWRPRAEEVVLRFAPDASPAERLAECVRSYTLQTVFARDLAAAQKDGLLTLTGLDSPAELAGCVLGPPVCNPAADGLLAALEQVRRFAGEFVALDGPEHLLARPGEAEGGDARVFARELAVGLRLTRLRAVVNLNAAAPPGWAGDLAGGPLFAGQRRPAPADQLARSADDLARELLRPEARAPVRIDWRLGERDFAPEEDKRERLTRLTGLALDGAPLGFVFDRPRRPAALAEGMDRQHPAVLLTVGIHLPRLAEQPGVDGDPARFLKKLGSLARLALSAAVQKREHLRRLDQPPAGPAVTDGFLLPRARLLVAPVGLDAVVGAFLGRGMCSGKAALDFARQIVGTLRDVLRRDGALSHLDACLDGPFAFHLGDGLPDGGGIAGLTPWDAAAPVKKQLGAAGALHAAAGGGTLALFAPGDATAEQAADWLRIAWQQGDLSRLRLLRDAGGAGS